MDEPAIQAAWARLAATVAEEDAAAAARLRVVAEVLSAMIAQPFMSAEEVCAHLWRASRRIAFFNAFPWRAEEEDDLSLIDLNI